MRQFNKGELFYDSLFICTLLSVSASAFEFNGHRGRDFASFDKNEVCILPETPMPELYSPKDKKAEKELCSYSFRPKASSNFAVCTKMRSTNPAVEIYKLKKNISKNQFLATCKNERPKGGKKLAKFKAGLTCSYTPSIVGYYHMGRIFNFGDIPQVTLRTMDKALHLAYTKYAVKHTRNKGPIKKSWALFLKAHNSRKWKYGWRVFNDRRTHVYGALTKNVRGESWYTELNRPAGKKFKYATRYKDFQKTAPFKKISDRRHISWFAPNEKQKAMQLIQQMKDASDMILVDYLMNQQDRIGNIHYRYRWALIERGKLKFAKVEMNKNPRNKKQKIIDPKHKAKMKKMGAVVIKKMILKDNDCGVRKTNYFKATKALEKIRHLNLDTYRRLLWFYKKIQTKEWQNFFKNELLFTNSDLNRPENRYMPGLIVNTKYAVKLLKSRCKRGHLHLDLNPVKHFANNNITDSKKYCELPNNYEPQN